ncbi:S1C family serine protease [Streptomyces zingiberis]|uniref:Trypsin-like serine protease n=1 Tax=Streptomyces zingiberis TaxID=2053010 RepID=A0ABX1BSK4_9ACTN|nr:trypsin-like peptidase domain-containing protein [Streptomyces zingiberis]NJQ00053.1 trypsin-like serine protease [Streptomyces zingiberis]
MTETRAYPPQPQRPADDSGRPDDPRGTAPFPAPAPAPAPDPAPGPAPAGASDHPAPGRPTQTPPFVTPEGTTIWPSGHTVPSPGGDDAGAAHGAPPAGPPPQALTGVSGHGRPRHRRRRGPLALLAAVAVVAGAVGGGAGWAAGGLADAGRPAASTTVSATGVSEVTDGSVASVAETVRPSVVEIHATSASGQSSGSGVITSADGEILTNNHVVSGATSIEVVFDDGTKATADVRGSDPDLDLALLQARDVSGLTPAVLGDSAGVTVGDQVVAIGSPEGLTGTVTSGIVSALDREVTVGRDDGGQQSSGGDGRQWPFEFGGGQYNGQVGGDTTTYPAIQTDASLNPGNSGGPLIDMDGRIIGINSAMYAPGTSGGSGTSATSAGSVGLGFAIPIDEVKKVMDELRSGDGG